MQCLRVVVGVDEVRGTQVGVRPLEMDSLDSTELNREDPHVVDDLDDDDLSEGESMYHHV